LTGNLSISRYKTRTPGLQPAAPGEHPATQRQSQIPGWDQKLLLDFVVFCIGAGGLGSRYYAQLARMGAGHLIFCDEDQIEPSNLNRQQFYPEQLYQNKAVALYHNLQREATCSTILEAYPLFFQDVLRDYPEALDGVNLIACLVDNDETRLEAARYGLEHKIPVLFSAVSRTTLNGYVFLQDPDKGPCFSCLNPPKEGVEEDMRCTEPSVVYIHGGVVSIAVYATTALAMGWPLKWNYFELFLDSPSRVLTREKRDDCQLCGGR